MENKTGEKEPAELQALFLQETINKRKTRYQQQPRAGENHQKGLSSLTYAKQKST